MRATSRKRSIHVRRGGIAVRRRWHADWKGAFVTLTIATQQPPLPMKLDDTPPKARNSRALFVGRLFAVALVLVLGTQLLSRTSSGRVAIVSETRVLASVGWLLGHGAAVRARTPGPLVAVLDRSPLGPAVERLTGMAVDQWRSGSLTPGALLLHCLLGVLLLVGSAHFAPVAIAFTVRGAATGLSHAMGHHSSLRELPDPFALIWYADAPLAAGRAPSPRLVALPALTPIPLRPIPPAVRTQHGLSPLGRRLLQIYCAAPATPPDVQGVRGKQTLLAHVLDTSTRARRLAPTFGIEPWLAEVLVLAHDLGKVFVFRRATPRDGWTWSGELHSRASARVLWRVPEFRALPHDVGEALRMVAKYHHDPENLPLDLRPDDDTPGTLAQRLLALLRLADQQSTNDAKSVVAPSTEREARVPLREAIEIAFERHNVNQHKPDAHYQGFVFADGLLVLPEAEFRERVIDALRERDPDLAVELGSALRRRRGTVHKALDLIVDRFRDAGALVEQPPGSTEASVLWNVRVGRKTWNACLLLDTRGLVSASLGVTEVLLARWGTAPFDREIRGPTRVGSAAPAPSISSTPSETAAPTVDASEITPHVGTVPARQRGRTVSSRPREDPAQEPPASHLALRTIAIPMSDEARGVVAARSQAFGLSVDDHARNLLIREAATAAARFLKQSDLRTRLRSVPLAETGTHVTDAELAPIVSALAAREQLAVSAWIVRALDRAVGVRR